MSIDQSLPGVVSRIQHFDRATAVHTSLHRRRSQVYQSMAPKSNWENLELDRKNIEIEKLKKENYYPSECVQNVFNVEYHRMVKMCRKSFQGRHFFYLY